MKIFLLAFTILIVSRLTAQTDTLRSGVTTWNNLKSEKTQTGERRQLFQGSTRDLADLSIHASTIAPGQTNHPPRAHTEFEELIIVKEGRLTVMINDSARTIGPGSLAMIIAGDSQSFRNDSPNPATYYVLRLKSKKTLDIPRGKKAGGSLVKEWTDLVMRKTDKGESRPIFDRPSSMFGRFEMHATALNPGFASHDPHTHRAEEIILMIKGDVTQQIDQSFHPATAGDLIYLASNNPHATKNTGKVQCGYFAIQWINDAATPAANNSVKAQNFDSAGIIAAGAQPVLISDQFTFTEGPAVDKKGNIFFTDQPNDKIWKYGTDGMLSVFLDKTGRSNGLYFDKKGNLLACADENSELWSITPKKKITVIAKGYKGQRLNGPNDLWIAPNGGIYLTDPYYQRPYWTRKTPEITGNKLYYLPKGKRELQIADESFNTPNGIVGTPDGKYLYVADLGAVKTYRFTIQPDGSLNEKKLIAEQGSDGMTIDNKGNIYLTGNGVTVYDPAGKKIAYIPVPARWTGNVCFGGKERNKLLITASKSVFVLDMKVKGVE